MLLIPFAQMQKLWQSKKGPIFVVMFGKIMSFSQLPAVKKKSEHDNKYPAHLISLGLYNVQKLLFCTCMTHENKKKVALKSRIL